MTDPATSHNLTRLSTALMQALNVLPLVSLACAASVLTTPAAFAQQAPDAGRLLQQDRAAPTPPKASPALQIAPPASAASLPGGAKVTIKDLHFTGNTRFDSAQLRAALKDVSSQPHDLAGLRALAQQVSEFYRSAGYPFARAMIPEQKFADGVLEIAVIEGRYGRISATGEARFSAAAQAFLADLAPGAVIESSSLERSTLILSDQPGVLTAPLIRPGQELGTGDLVLDVARAPAFKGEVGVDNQGNRYTGEYRARASLQWDSPFLFGDQITVRGNVSDEAQWLGNLGYSLPLGASGLRGNVAYAHSRYELAKEFASLNATGTAHIASLGLAYPLLRSQRSNLSLTGSYQHKRLKDQQGTTQTEDNKTSQVLPLALQFDHRDDLAGGGISYGSLTFSAGQLKMDAALQAADASTAKTQGSFNKWNLDLARVQATGVSDLSLFGRVSTQWANKNLDSSEDFGLGGSNGVRAYPGGEGFGDEGWLAQLEARYQVGNLAPFAFFDAGSVKTNKQPWSVGVNDRKLSGYGVGLRYADTHWIAESTLAWRDRGGPATSDTKNKNPRLWLTLGWRF